MSYLKKQNLIIHVPKFQKGRLLFESGSPRTVFVENNETLKVYRGDLKNKYSFFFRVLAVLVVILMFMSPLSPFIGTLYADEDETDFGTVEKEVGLIESEKASDKSDEGQESVEEEGEQENNKDVEKEEIETDKKENDLEKNNEDGVGSTGKISDFVEEDEVIDDKNEEGRVEGLENEHATSNEEGQDGQEEKEGDKEEIIKNEEEITKDETESGDVEDGEHKEVEDGKVEEEKGSESEENQDDTKKDSEQIEDILVETEEKNDLENNNSSDDKVGDEIDKEDQQAKKISDEEYQKLRVEIESEIRAELEKELERFLTEQKEVLELPGDFSLDDCTFLSDKELYCLSDKNNYRQFSENHIDITSYPDKNGIHQIVLRESAGRARVLTDDDVDNTSPVYNKEGALAAWQRYVDDRWQVVIYDLEINEEVFVTKSTFNNISPELSSSAVVWQGWANNGWEIFYADKNEGDWRVRQLTEGGFQNVKPRVFGDNVVWSSYRAGEWHIISYSLKTKKKEVLGTGKKNIEPRFALIWEDPSRGDNGSLMHLDLSTNRIAPLTEKDKEEPKPSPVPNPFESGQTEAVQTPTGRSDYDESDDERDNDDDVEDESAEGVDEADR